MKIADSERTYSDFWLLTSDSFFGWSCNSSLSEKRLGTEHLGEVLES
jgi:hypothetical protein